MKFDTQPAPIANDHPVLWDLIKKDLTDPIARFDPYQELYETLLGTVFAMIALKDLKPGDDPVAEDFESIEVKLVALADARNQFGISKYGVPLQPFNGRNFREDMLEEALDLLVYFRGWLYERTGK